MCSRYVWRQVVLSVAAIATATTASAQTVAQYAKRVDSLAAIWRAAVALKVRADSERVHELPADTIRIGNLVVLSNAAYADLAKAAAAAVSPALDRRYGSWATRMRQHILVVRPPRQRRIEGDTTAIETGVVSADGSLRWVSSIYATRDALAAAWLRKAEQYLTQDLDPPFREWLGVPIPVRPMTARGLVSGRVDLVLSRSLVAHECAVGTPGACARVLGLEPVDDPAFTLFDQRQRLDMIEWYSFVLQRRDPARYTRCVSGGSQATCDSLVRSIPQDAIPKPASPAVRLNFVQYALMLGGDGAFDRLATPSGNVSDRIAAAARMPVDSVISRWQSNLMQSPSSSTAIDAVTAISSIAWACVCGALALRSSRWR
jgi:hypothetical protein